MISAGAWGSYIIRGSGMNRSILRILANTSGRLVATGFMLLFCLVRTPLARAEEKPEQAIRQLHQTLYLNPADHTIREKLEQTIRQIGKDPASLEDRTTLGDEARRSGDFVGALVEFSEALRIKDSPAVRMHLGDTYRVRDEIDKAIEEYQRGMQLQDSPELQVRLGQAHQAKRDLRMAVTAYERAWKLGPEDPDVFESLYAWWEQAAKEDPNILQLPAELKEKFHLYNTALGRGRIRGCMVFEVGPPSDSRTVSQIIADYVRSQERGRSDEAKSAR